MSSELREAAKLLLKDAAKEAQTLYLKAVKELKDNPKQQLSVSGMQDLAYVHTRLEQKGELKGIMKPVATFVEEHLLKPALQQEQRNSHLPTLQPAPKPLAKDDPAVAKHREDFLQENNLRQDQFGKLSAPTQAALIASQARPTNPALAKQLMQQSVSQTLEASNSASFMNRVMDNSGNEMGMTKLGPTTSVVLQGGIHGALGGALQDIKSQNDLPNKGTLAGKLSEEYDVFAQDKVADGELNERYQQNLLEDLNIDATNKKSPTPFDIEPKPEGG